MSEPTASGDHDLHRPSTGGPTGAAVAPLGFGTDMGYPVITSGLPRVSYDAPSLAEMTAERDRARDIAVALEKVAQRGWSTNRMVEFAREAIGACLACGKTDCADHGCQEDG